MEQAVLNIPKYIYHATPYRILKLQTKEGTKKHAAIYLAMPNCN